MSNVYRHADAAMKRLKRYIAGEFQRLASTASWDEVNVLQMRQDVSDIYDRIDQMTTKEFEEVIRKTYRDAGKEIHQKPTSEPGLIFLLGLLSSPNRVTQYVYTHEWERKKDRLVESLMSVDGSQAARQALKRALDLMVGQVEQTSINITDEAREKLFEDAGIEYERWITQRDSKVCGTCAERDGKIYRVGHTPPKHYRCRCYFEAVDREQVLSPSDEGLE